MGFEHQRQLIRYRPVNELSNSRGDDSAEFEEEFDYGPLVRSEEFVESKDVVTTAAIIVRGGVLINLSPRFVLRTGHSWILTYFDSPPSQSIEVGIGYRF